MSFAALPSAPAAGPLLIEPANQAATQGGRPVVPGAVARLIYLPSVVVVLVLCTVGLAINATAWRELAALKAAGAPATARVVDIDTTRLVGRSRLYSVTFAYRVPGPDGVVREYESSDMATGRRFEHGRFFLGQEQAIRYLPADPTVARFAASAPPTLWLALFFAATGVALCVLLYFGKWSWDDATLRRRGQACVGAVTAIRPSLWPRTRQVAYRFVAPDGRQLEGRADIDARRLGEAGDPRPGTPVVVLFVSDGLYTML